MGSPDDRLPRWAHALLPRLGVLPQAWDGWSKVHVDAFKGFALCTLTSVVGMSVTGSSLLVACTPLGWGPVTPCVVYVVCHLAVLLNIWRYGPMVSKTPQHYVFGSVGALAIICAVLPAMAMPERRGVPFGNRLLFICALTLGCWATNLSVALGLWGVDLPRQPRRSAL